eukprot:UN32683
MATTVADLKQQGFNFENTTRNAGFLKFSPDVSKLAKLQKTGTTICAALYKDGVILAADTRATAGPVVADKNCYKIHRISDKIYCCGAGTAADCDYTTRELEQNTEFQRLEMGKEPRVVSVLTRLKRKLFQYQGYVGAYIIVGGVDALGPNLFTCHAHGSTDNLPFVTMGSGSLAAMSEMETGWKPNMTEKECRNLCIEAIKKGILNDLGSGSNCDVCTITKDGSRLERAVYSSVRTNMKLKVIPTGAPVIVSQETLWEGKDAMEVEEELADK